MPTYKTNIRLFPIVCLLADGGYFLYNGIQKEVNRMEGYDNDELLLLLDDDLFFCDDEQERSSK